MILTKNYQKTRNSKVRMYFHQDRKLLCLLNNTTNTRRRTQSIFSPTECRSCGTFDPFRTFHPSLHESVTKRTGEI